MFFQDGVIIHSRIHENLAHLQIKRLDGVCAFIDRENLGIAGVLLDGILLAIAIPAVNLHGFGGYQPRCIRNAGLDYGSKNFDDSRCFLDFLGV